MRLLKVIFVLVLFCLFGCSESQETQKTPEPQTPSPGFVTTDDPKVFFENYRRDLMGGDYLPETLVTELKGATRLDKASALIVKHHTIAFVEWYFSSAYLTEVRKLVAEKVARMDYQLKVLDVPASAAGDVILVIDAGPLAHRKIFSQEGLEETWRKIDGQTLEVTLSRGRGIQVFRVVKEGGAWKLEPGGS